MTISIKKFSIPQLSTESYEIDFDKPVLQDLTIYDNYLYYESISSGKLLDEDLGMKVDKYFNNSICLKKYNVCNIEMYYQNSEDCWRVEISMKGTDRLILLCFKQKSFAQEINKYLIEWYLN